MNGTDNFSQQQTSAVASPSPPKPAAVTPRRIPPDILSELSELVASVVLSRSGELRAQLCTVAAAEILCGHGEGSGHSDDSLATSISCAIASSSSSFDCSAGAPPRVTSQSLLEEVVSSARFAALVQRRAMAGSRRTPSSSQSLTPIGSPRRSSGFLHPSTSDAIAGLDCENAELTKCASAFVGLRVNIVAQEVALELKGACETISQTERLHRELHELDEQCERVARCLIYLEEPITASFVSKSHSCQVSEVMGRAGLAHQESILFDFLQLELREKSARLVILEQEVGQKPTWEPPPRPASPLPAPIAQEPSPAPMPMRDFDLSIVVTVELPMSSAATLESLLTEIERLKLAATAQEEVMAVAEALRNSLCCPVTAFATVGGGGCTTSLVTIHGVFTVPGDCAASDAEILDEARRAIGVDGALFSRCACDYYNAVRKPYLVPRIVDLDQRAVLDGSESSAQHRPALVAWRSGSSGRLYSPVREAADALLVEDVATFRAQLSRSSSKSAASPIRTRSVSVTVENHIMIEGFVRASSFSS